MTVTVCRNKKGFTLIEVAIVLTIVGLVIGGIWMAASTVTHNRKKAQFSDDLFLIIQTMKDLYINKDLSGYTTEIAIQSGIVPTRMVDAGRQTAHHPFSSEPGSFAINATGANNQQAPHFWLSMKNVPQDACIELMVSRIGPNAQAFRTIGLVTAGGAPLPANYADGITPAEAMQYWCNADPVADMVIEFSL